MTKTKTTEARSIKSSFLAEALARVNPVIKRKIDNQMYLSALIADSLDEKGMKQKDLADKLDKSPSLITRWLSGDHNFTIDTLSEIEIALDIKLINRENQEANEAPIGIIHGQWQRAKAPPLQQWSFIGRSRSTSTNTIF